MNNVFKCGLVKVGQADEQPDWNEFVTRVGFAQENFDLSATFMSAFVDSEIGWVVPFFCVEDSMGRFANVQTALRECTPYEIVGVKKLDLSRADLETLGTLSALVSEPARAVRINDVTPGIVGAPPESPEDVFCDLVGMKKQRDVLMKLSTAVAKHGRKAVECFHFVFSGSPGTGKTELAMRFSSYLDFIGVTDGTGKMVKVGEADLVARYVGHTSPKVRQVVESALGGVLFIDEFYAIANADPFGQEALDTLVDLLDAHRHAFVCIVAGYRDQMDDTLDRNPGLRDRFGYRIDFPDYDDHDLAKIFVSMANKRGFSVEDMGAVEKCAGKLRSSRGFSNARTMRKLVDHAVVEASCARDEAKICACDVRAATNEIYDATRRTAGF